MKNLFTISVPFRGLVISNAWRSLNEFTPYISVPFRGLVISNAINEFAPYGEDGFPSPFGVSLFQIPPPAAQ